jgi:hypothetical protein
MTDSIAGILERKKKEIEQEIADFRSTKEDEYRAFERQLVRGVCDSAREVEGREDGKRPEKQNSLSNQKKPPHRELSELKKLGFESFNGTVRAQELGDPVIERSETATDSSHYERSRGWQEGHLGSLDKTRIHERELEFQGLFTPSFLPLLDCKDRHRSVAAYGESQIDNDSPSISLDNGKQVRGSDARKTKLGLSSSASFPNAHHSSSLSPPPVRPMSASVPRQPPHQRRSSSRSDTSIASLRSSLRDPRQPRSPKRVLFSIGDKLVSPSTSPLMQRAIAESSIINASSSISRDEPESTRIQSNVWDMFPWTKKSADIAPVGIAPAGFRNAQPQPFPTGVSIRSPFLGGDDFERIETEDDLFAFDEDLTIGKSGGEEGDRETTITGSDENEDGDESLPAGSPHAGSLPIEIKWPSKFMPPS